MNSAIISECGRYRYRLDRDVQQEGLVFAFFGVNPSTADASINDPTVRKWIGFSERNGVKRFIVGNVFSYRATDVNDLRSMVSSGAQGDEHHQYLAEIIAEADVLVPCWGRLAKMPKELRSYPSALLDLMNRSGKPVLHFGITGCGQPMHPLMLAYATPMTPWSKP